jgi:hypothetical protein
MTAIYENGSDPVPHNGNGMNARVLVIAALSVSLVFCWFVICALTGTDTSRLSRGNWTVIYPAPATKPPQNPQR